MKKYILICILILLLLSGCRKISGCGVVKGGDYDISTNGTHSYYLWIKFLDSSRERKVYVDYKTFLDFRIGTEICF
jgi:predicted small secreted protein